MQHSQLISMRIDKDTLGQVDKIRIGRSYLTRSRVITSILECVIRCAKEEDILKMCHSFDPYSDGFVINVSTLRKF